MPAFDMAVQPGMEWTTHAVHLINLGARRQYHPRTYRPPDFERQRAHPPAFGYAIERLVADVHQDGGKVVVGHWWMPWTRKQISWTILANLGVDGSEVTNGPDRAPQDLIDQWRARGLFLIAGTDFHGRHKSINTWNLVDRKAVNPEGVPLNQIDPYVLVDRIFARRAARPIIASTDAPGIPVWLEPPVGFWRYYTRLGPAQRVQWAAFAMLLWGAKCLAARLRALSARTTSPPESRVTL